MLIESLVRPLSAYPRGQDVSSAHALRAARLEDDGQLMLDTCEKRAVRRAPCRSDAARAVRVFGIAGGGIARGSMATYSPIQPAGSDALERSGGAAFAPLTVWRLWAGPWRPSCAARSLCVMARFRARCRGSACASWRLWKLVEPEFAAVVFHFRRLDDPAGSNPHRVQLAVEFRLPEMEERVSAWRIVGSDRIPAKT